MDMSDRRRYLSRQVESDLREKMVLLGGPRQVGKTTLAKALLGVRNGYLNWDIPKDRTQLLAGEMPHSRLWVLDEIHKFKGWRNLLKGLYDGKSKQQQILVTGSARLDLYRRGGDSLQGRYHFLRLHPLSAAELKLKKQSDLKDLLDLSGFPEPYFSSSRAKANRWSNEYRTRLIEEDVTSLEQTQDLGRMELALMRLPDLVGSPLSIHKLSIDIQVSPKTLAKWIQIFEKLYGLFRLSPFGAPLIKAVKKEQKHYHFDWSTIEDRAFRFENLVAVHLLKWVQFEYDTKGRNLDLRYFRDVEQREVDFVVIEKNRPILLVEAKWSDAPVQSSLRYLKQKFPSAEAWQVSFEGKKDFVTKEGIRVAPAIKLLSTLC